MNSKIVADQIRRSGTYFEFHNPAISELLLSRIIRSFMTAGELQGRIIYRWAYYTYPELKLNIPQAENEDLRPAGTYSVWLVFEDNADAGTFAYYWGSHFPVRRPRGVNDVSR